MVGKLRCRDVEAEGEGQQQAENGGRAEQRVDADEEACGEAPGELFRGGPAAKQGKDGERDAPVGPVMVWNGGITDHV